MKNKKIMIYVLIVLSLLLISGGVIYSLYFKEPIEQEEKTETNEKKGNDSENYKVAELGSIITPDKKIRLGSARVYECNGITGTTLNIIPYENFDSVYLKLTMNLSKTKEEVVIHLENLQTSVQTEREVQTLNDWSTLKSWTVEIIPEDEAKKIWDSQK